MHPKLLLLLSLAATTPNGSNGVGNFHQVIEHDCDGNFYMMPSYNDLGFAVGADGFMNKLFNAVREHIISTATCHCPNLASTGNEDKFFGIGLELVLRMVQRDNSSDWTRAKLDSICNGDSAFNRGNGQDNYLPVDLKDHIDPYWNAPPSTCTASNYQSEGCFFKWQMAGVELQIAAQQCPENGKSKLPYLSISLAGALPEYFMRPCQSDADCDGAVINGAKATCDDPVSLIEENPSINLGKVAADLLEEANLFSTTQCSMSTTVMGDKIMDMLMGGMGQMAAMNVNTTSYRRMCGMKLIRETIENEEITVTIPGEDGDKKIDDDCDENKDCANGLACLYTESYGGEGRCKPCSYCTVASQDNMGNMINQTKNYEDNCLCDARSVIVLPNAFQAWDGVLANGQNVKSYVNRRHPRAPSVEIDRKVTAECKESYNAGQVVPIMQHQCRVKDDSLDTGAYLFTPLSPLKFASQTPFVQKMIKLFALPMFSSIIDNCHSGNQDLLKDYTPWHIGFWIRLLNAGVAPTEAPMGYAYTLYELFHNLIEWDGTMAFPSTCSQDRWENEGTCQFQITTAHEIFGFAPNSLNLRMTLSKCNEDPEALPFFYMDCVGSKCSYLFEFYNIKMCQQDSDCESQKCSSFDDDKYKIKFEDNADYTGSGLLQYGLWKGTSTDTCGDHTNDLKELVDLAHVLADKPPVTSNTGKWCETIVENPPDEISDKLEDFMNNLVEESQNSFGTTHYKIRGLSEWVELENDGCKHGIDGGFGATHSEIVGPEKAKNPKSSLKVNIETGDAQTFGEVTANEQTLLAFKQDFINALKYSIVQSSTPVAPEVITMVDQISVDDIYVIQTTNGLEVVANMDEDKTETQKIHEAFQNNDQQDYFIESMASSSSFSSGTKLLSVNSEVSEPIIDDSSGLSAGAIAGIVAGLVLFLVVVILGIMFLIKKPSYTNPRRSSYRSQNNSTVTMTDVKEFQAQNV